MTYDEKMNLVETKVSHVSTRQVDSWIFLRTEGKKYYVTEEHPFYTTRGIVTAADLIEGDMILHSNPKEKISFNKIVENPMKNPDSIKKRLEKVDYKAIGRKISEFYKNHPGLYSRTISEEQRKKISIANSGENNGNWKGGKRKNYNFLKSQIRKGEINCCYHCHKQFAFSEIKGKGHSRGLDVHHRDGDKNNDSMDNLVVLCESCHYSKHKMGYNFWSSERLDGKTLVHPMYNGIEVKKVRRVNRLSLPHSVRPKPLNVVTLSCEPYNTYLVDYMWVHNCDTPRAQKITDGTVMALDEIVDETIKWRNRNVTITGGEPLIFEEELQGLCRLLRDEDFQVSVETNGTFEIPTRDWSPVHCWVADWKGPSSGERKRMSPKNFRHLLSHDVVKFVIGCSEDFDDALAAIEDINRVVLEYPTYAFSPMFGTIEPATVIRWMSSNLMLRKLGAVFSYQIHKAIGVS